MRFSAALLVPLCALAACASRVQLAAPGPDRTVLEGDTALLGPLITAVDPRARVVRLEVRADAVVYLFAIDQEDHLHLMASCWLAAGRHEVRPTLADHSALARSGRVSAEHVWSWREGYDAVLVIAIAEEPRLRRDCDNSGTGSLVATMPPNEALHNYAKSLRRYPTSPWAAQIVEP